MVSEVLIYIKKSSVEMEFLKWSFYDENFTE